MNTAETIFSIIGGLVILLITAAGIWVTFSSATKEAMRKRLLEENTYLRGQLDFIEPRFRDAEQKNEMLLRLHNPTAKLDQMSAMEKANHSETVRLLNEQHAKLDEIKNKVEERR